MVFTFLLLLIKIPCPLFGDRGMNSHKKWHISLTRGESSSNFKGEVLTYGFGKPITVGGTAPESHRLSLGMPHRGASKPCIQFSEFYNTRGLVVK
jgi:hypothetical protein